MGIRSGDIVPLNQVRARFTELAAAVRDGAEKIITRNGEGYVALIDARRLDHYHRVEREHIHLQLLEQAVAGMQDVAAGRTMSLTQLRARYGTRSARKRR
jgi:prevent-host-death family protein